MSTPCVKGFVTSEGQALYDFNALGNVPEVLKNIPVAEVGQFLRVESIDEEGKILSVSPISLTGEVIPTSEGDDSSIKDRVSSLNDYVYSTEKISKFVTSTDSILEINTDNNTIKVSSGYLFYRNSRMEISETTVSIDQSSVFSMVIYDISSKKINSINPTSFSGNTMFLIALLRKGYYTIPTANYVIGSYKVNGYLYNAPVKQPVYVATTGSDSNIGDRNHPFKTVSKAISSGAKTIYIMAGIYKEPIVASRTGGEIEILAKPLSNSNSEVILDFGEELSLSVDSATGLVKSPYTSTVDSYIYKVFVAKTESLTVDDSRGYNCNLWSGETRLKPVLTLAECQSTSNSWFYDGSNVYANATAGTFTLNTGDVSNAISFSYFKFVKLSGITVKHARENGVLLKGCADSDISRCKFMYSGIYHGLSLENTSSTVRNCEAYFNGKDGLNIHGVSTADFFDCISHDNLDDGISHHDISNGLIIGGEYYNNVKGGVCCPTFGSRNSINGVYIHDNGNGVYAVTQEDGEYPLCTVSDCRIENNDIGIRSSRYTLKCWNISFADNGQDVMEENGGNVTVHGDSAGGYSPVKGVDYWTEEDRNAIVKEFATLTNVLDPDTVTSADGSELTDDSAKIQRCFDLLAENGGVITVTRTYTLTADIVINHNSTSHNNLITVAGTGQTPRIDFGAYCIKGGPRTDDGSRVAYGGVIFENLRLTGDNIGFDCSNLIRLTFSNCMIRGFKYFVFAPDVVDDVRDDSANVYMQSVYIMGCYIRSSVDTAIKSMGGVYDTKIIGCVCEQGARLFSAASTIDSLSITDSCIEGFSEIPIVLAENNRAVNISNNYFETNGSGSNIDASAATGSATINISNNLFCEYKAENEYTGVVKLPTHIDNGCMTIAGNHCNYSYTVLLLIPDGATDLSKVYAFGNHGTSNILTDSEGDPIDVGLRLIDPAQIHKAINGPEKGVDYWTAEEKAEMVDDVLAAMSGEVWTFEMSDGSVIERTVATAHLTEFSSEAWAFTMEDGSVINKEVSVV